MNEKTSVELEREAEIARARLADTADTIRGKLTAGQLIDEFTNMFSGGDGSRAFSNLKSQIRDNPLPLALVGAGLAWLALGQGVSPSSTASMSGTDGEIPGADWDRGSESAGSSVGSMAASATEAVSEAAAKVGRAGESAKATAGRIAEGSADYMNRLSAGSSDYLHRARRSTRNVVDQEPLVLAAFGFAVGTAIGVMLPASSFEKDELGPHAEKLRKDAGEFIEKGIEDAKDVAAKAYEAVSEEADRQGLKPNDGGSVAERAGKVLTSAADTTEEAVRDKLKQETTDKSKS